MGISKAQQKEYARVLYVKERLSQKLIAERVGVTEKTIGKWAETEGWRKQRVALSTTKDNEIQRLYAALEAVHTEIAARPVVRDIPIFLLKPFKLRDAEGNERIEYPFYNPDDYPVKSGPFANSKDSDTISKLTKAIKQLEFETGVGEAVEVTNKLLQFAQELPGGFTLAKTIAEVADKYITSIAK